MIKNNDNVGFHLLPKANNIGPVVYPFRASRKLYVQTKIPNKLQKSDKISAVKLSSFHFRLHLQAWNKDYDTKLSRILRRKTKLKRTIELELKILSFWAEFWGVKRETLSRKGGDTQNFIVWSWILRCVLSRKRAEIWNFIVWSPIMRRQTLILSHKKA